MEVSMKNVCKSFGKQPVLNNMTLNIHSGEIVWGKEKGNGKSN